jgi:retinol dehydrogenase-12
MTAAAPVDLAGKVALVTGATGGMGRVIVTRLASLGATVVIVARSQAGGDRLRRQVCLQVGADRVEVLTADLASRSDLHRLAADVTVRHPTLDLLVNNAGAHYRDRTLDADGVEMHIAVNHLAPFTLTNLLLDPLRAAAPARIVTVVSDAFSDTRQVKILPRPRPIQLDTDHLDDLAHLNAADGFDPFLAYARAKLLTLMCGYLLAERLRGTGVTLNAVHPGLVATDILNDIAPTFARPFLAPVRRLLLTPTEGAQAALHLATAPELAEVTGRYFVRHREGRSPRISYDAQLQQRIWDLSDAYATPATNDGA